MSVSDVAGIRIGRDIRTVGFRVTVPRGDVPSPWIDALYFSRPDLSCLPDLPCNGEGYLVRLGAALGLSDRRPDRRVGLAVRAGLGAAFAETTTFAYVVGLGLQWHALGTIAPFAEVRWEHTTGINVTMFAAGLRAGF